MAGVSEHFRLRLQNELNSRCRANARYSLRAFARSLRLESSALSRILSGKRKVTPSMFQKLSERLALTPSEVASFVEVTPTSAPPAEIDQDTFNLIGQWQNFAILELARVKGFKPEARWISKRLRITASEAKLALERLSRFGMLETKPDGTYQVKTPNTTTTHQRGTSAALKTLQKDLLKKAAEAMEEIDIEERDQSAVCVALTKAQFLETKERIRLFRKEILSLAEKTPLKDEVYQLVLSLYPLSYSRKERKNA